MMLRQQKEEVQLLKQQQRWRCDICRVLTFPSFEEACDHEALCQNSNRSRDNTPNDAIPKDAIISLSSSCSLSSMPSMSPNEISEAPNDSIPASTRIRNTPTIDVFHSTAKKKAKQRQATITTTLKHKPLDPQPTPAVVNEKRFKTLGKRALQKTVVSVKIEGDVVQVLEARSPNANTIKEPLMSQDGTIRTKRIRHGDPVDVDLSSDDIVTPKTDHSKMKKLKKSTSHTATRKIQGGRTVPKLTVSTKKRSNKTLDYQSKNATSSSSSVRTNTMMDWFAIPTIAEGENENIINVDDDTTFDVEQEKLMTEQVIAYQFREERRQKQQAEREKQLRRQQLHMMTQQHFGDTSTKVSKSSKMNSTTVMEVVDVTDDVVKTTVRSKLPTSSIISRVTAINAIRFPMQSHTIPPMTGRPVICDMKSMDITSKGQTWWNPISNMERITSPSVRQPSSKWSIPSKYTNTGSSQMNNNGGNSLDSNHHRNEVLDLLQTAIYSSIIPIPSSGSTTSRNDGTLWVDRYYNDSGKNSESICTDTTSDVYNQIHNFIERFMLERQKVERANIVKQNKQRQSFFGLPTTSNPKNKSTTSKRRNFDDDDDDLWDDDEYNNSNSAFDADRWSSLCVISGPIGCRKSNIVHRVAKQLGCRKVVELHTGMKRSAASMKRIVEEATKSHSTFDMMQNQCRGVIDDVSLDDRGSAVTVILIDEVDNLDPDTDCGFWSALCELHKESKCPIVVTCNLIPKELNASSFHWTHVPMERPTATECAIQLRSILLQEGYTVVQHTNNGTVDPNDPLATIAKLGYCDMRRILQELQLFHSYTLSACSWRSDDFGLVLPAVKATHEAFQPFPFATIELVHPNILYFDRYTSITVKGSNFFSLMGPKQAKDRYHCKVYVGSYCCPQAQIMNDSTILAVVTPSQGMKYRYLPVNVASKSGLGILSSTRNSIMKMELPNQTKILSAGLACLIECRYGATAQDDESDPENEFDADVSREIAHKQLLESASEFEKGTNNILDSNLALEMLTESVDSYEARCGATDGQETISTTFPKVTAQELYILDQLETSTGLASDASLFEDVGLNPLPMLSGACRGFGFAYTEDAPKRSNEHSKPYVQFSPHTFALQSCHTNAIFLLDLSSPTEEQLYLSGWKDKACFYGSSDYQMTRDPMYRERKLLRWNEASIRGCSLQYSGAVDEDETDQYCDNAPPSSDEDYLLSNQIPTPLFDLPHLLNASNATFPSLLQFEVYKQRKKSVRTEALHLLRDSLFTNTKSMRYTRRLDMPLTEAEHGFTDVSTGTCMLDSDVFLDYIPLLRCMAEQESVAEFISKTQDVSTTRKRTTRLSIRLGREHYFDKIVARYTWKESNQTSKDVADRLASMSLLNKV